VLDGGEEGEVGAALVVVRLSADTAKREAGIRDDMIRVGHRAGASVRQLAEIAGLGRKSVTAIVSSDARAQGDRRAPPRLQRDQSVRQRCGRIG
jgi:hypothetical protein